MWADCPLLYASVASLHNAKPLMGKQKHRKIIKSLIKNPLRLCIFLRTVWPRHKTGQGETFRMFAKACLG